MTRKHMVLLALIATVALNVSGCSQTKAENPPAQTKAQVEEKVTDIAVTQPPETEAPSLTTQAVEQTPEATATLDPTADTKEALDQLVINKYGVQLTLPEKWSENTTLEKDEASSKDGVMVYVLRLSPKKTALTEKAVLATMTILPYPEWKNDPESVEGKYGKLLASSADTAFLMMPADKNPLDASSETGKLFEEFIKGYEEVSKEMDIIVYNDGYDPTASEAPIVVR